MNQRTRKSPRTTATADFCAMAGAALTDFLRRIGPPEAARRHFDAARVEILKGFRALIDARIERVSRATRKGQKIDVE